MTDEMDARVRALEAERLRPVPPPLIKPPVVDLLALAELCEALGQDEDDDP